MSQLHYIKKWDLAQTELARILRIERPLKPPPVEKSRKEAFDMVALRYVKYIGVYNRLQQCYDYMVHPQKRKLIARCLEGVTGRIVELREEFIRLDINEYSYLGDILADLKVDPRSLELTLSKSISLQKVATIRQRLNMLDYILASLNVDMDHRAPETVYTTQEAVLLLQKNERAYQARRRMQKIIKGKRGKLKTDREFVPLEEVSVRAVTLFQAMWRGLRDRKHLGKYKRENAMSLGMMKPLHMNFISVTENSIVSQKFKESQDNNDSFITDTIVATEDMLETQGPSMADKMKNEIMQWILECRSLTGQFPQFPDEDEGGSAILFSDKTLNEVEDDMDELQEQLSKGTKPAAPKKEEKKPKEDPKKKAKEPGQFAMKPSKVVDDILVGAAQEYGLLWRGREEKNNTKQVYDRNLMLEDVTNNVETMVRAQVDEMIRQELDRMRLVLDNQLPPKPKKKKDKKKKDKKKKGKKMKDLTPGMPIEDLYKDLVLDGIIKKVPNVPISGFLGEYNLMSSDTCPDCTMRPDLGDVRKMAVDFGILPMSSELVHARAPFCKSLIIVGPHGSGKKMLVHAIAHELGANFFDLSPENIEDKYEGKQGQEMLMHLVMKVGKAMEPSIIYIGNCDQMFTKKLSPEVAQLKPGRLKKDLTKAMKFVSPEDRIMLLGTSRYPFKAAVGPMMKLYSRLIFIHPPAHSSRYTLWERLIKEHKGILTDDFDLTAMSHVTRGYTAGDIYNAVTEVLTEKRTQKQNTYPIRASEFVDRIATFDPVYIPEMEEFERWLSKTPLAKRRTSLLKKEEEGVDIIGML